VALFINNIIYILKRRVSVRARHINCLQHAHITNEKRRIIKSSRRVAVDLSSKFIGEFEEKVRDEDGDD
jgi:hypothetical protein